MRAIGGASIGVVLIATLAVAGVALWAGPGETAPLSPAEALVEARRYAEALAVYEQLAARYPGDPTPYFRIAAIRRAQKLPARAVEAALLGLARDPQNAAGLALLGDLYADQGEWSLAAERYQASLAVNPAQPTVRVALGRVFIRQGQLGSAQAQMVLALNANSKCLAEAHYCLALLVAPDDATAARIHLAAAAADPAFADRARTFETTLAQTEIARQTGGDAYALTTWGAGYLQVNEPALAQPVLLHAVRIAPQYADAHAYLGHVMWLLGDARSALAELDTAIALDAGYAPAHHWRGLVLHSQGHYAEAIAAFQRAHSLQPADAAICADLGAAYEAQRDYLAAEEWLQKAIALAPTNGSLTLRLARFYVEHGLKPAGAGLLAASRATELLPQSAEAWELLGWVDFMNQEWKAARIALQHAVTLDRDRPSAHYRLGEVLRALGQEDEARREFQMALDLQPAGPWAERARQAIAGQ